MSFFFLNKLNVRISLIDFVKLFHPKIPLSFTVACYLRLESYVCIEQQTLNKCAIFIRKYSPHRELHPLMFLTTMRLR